MYINFFFFKNGFFISKLQCWLEEEKLLSALPVRRNIEEWERRYGWEVSFCV